MRTPAYGAARPAAPSGGAVAVAHSKAQDAALLRSSRLLLVRRGEGRRPPRRLPRPHLLLVREVAKQACLTCADTGEAVTLHRLLDAVGRARTLDRS
ncbi:hypothetical protein GCM10011579_097620 [Streptomyces albiflavescens]|uniref:Uncharacterized protein n=1 Tax=Streptomyces albiflavescens TaxID=1623582 RepID=A0A918DAF8_9ACTN|nr:hypothetical protein GCM10011579_097620 [Streptomyces albiflavescens]